MDLGKSDNGGTFYLSSGFQQYHKSCIASATNQWDDNDPIIVDTATVSNDETHIPTTRARIRTVQRNWKSLHHPNSFSMWSHVSLKTEALVIPKIRSSINIHDQAESDQEVNAVHQEGVNSTQLHNLEGFQAPTQATCPRHTVFTIPDLVHIENLTI